MMPPGLTIRESDGVLLWNGVPIEIRNGIWSGHPVVCAAARFDPKDGPTWRVDHATGALAEQIMALGAIDHRLESMWSLRAKDMGGGHDDPEDPRSRR